MKLRAVGWLTGLSAAAVAVGVVAAPVAVAAPTSGPGGPYDIYATVANDTQQSTLDSGHFDMQSRGGGDHSTAASPQGSDPPWPFSIYGTVNNATNDVTLDDPHFTLKHNTHFVVAPAANSIAAGQSDQWQAQGDPGGVDDGGVPYLYWSYRIVDNGVPTGFWLWGKGHGKQGSVAQASEHCRIYQGDPNRGGKQTSDSPYACTIHDSDGYNPHMTWTISKPGTTAVVTDPAQQRMILEQFCTNASDCTFELTDEQHITKPRRQIGPVAYVNNSDQTVDAVLPDYPDLVGQSDSVGIDLSVNTTIANMVKEQVNATYHHPLTASYLFLDQIRTALVPPQAKAWVTHAAPMIRDTGNFYIHVGKIRYTLPEVSFDSPDAGNSNGWSVNTGPIS